MRDQRRESFEVGESPRIELNLPSGDAVFLPGEPGRVEVTVDGRNADGFVIEQVGGRILLRPSAGLGSRWESFDVMVRMPVGADLEVRGASADVGVEVDLGSLNSSLASGELKARNVEGKAAVQSASGDVVLGEVGGNLAVDTASGDVRIQHSGGRAVVNTASGDVWIGVADGTLAISSQSGDLDVRGYAGNDLECASTSGDVRIGLPPGRALDVDLNTVSGDIRSDFATESPTSPPSPPSPPPATKPAEPTEPVTARLRVRTISGDIALVRAVGE